MILIEPSDLEHVGDEMVAPVVAAARWVFVVPFLVVHRNLHFGWVTIVQAVAAAVVLVAVEVLWIVHERIVVEAVIITTTGLSTRNSTVSVWILGIGLRASQHTQADRQKRSQQDFLEHIRRSPCELLRFWGWGNVPTPPS